MGDPAGDFLVWLIDDGGGEGEAVLAGVALDEAKAEFEVAEPVFAEGANGFAGFLTDGDEAVDGVGCEIDDEAMGLGEPGGKTVDVFVEQANFFGFILFEEPGKEGVGLAEGVGVDGEFGDGGGGEFEFEVAQDGFEDGHEAAGAGAFFGGADGNFTEGVGSDGEGDVIALEVGAVLAKDAAFGVEEDVFEVICGEGFADDADGEASDEFGFEAVVDEVAGGDLAEEEGFVIRGGGFGSGVEANGALLDAFADDGGEAVEGAADDEEDVFGVEGALAGFAAALEFEHGLHLADEVGLALEVDVGFLHKFEEVDLDASSGDVTTAVGGGAAGDFVDFVDVHDAVLGEVGVSIGGFDEVADDVVDVEANIAGFGEFGGVGFDERDANEFGDATHEVGFSDAGGAEEDDVLFGVFFVGAGGVVEAAADVVEMVADGDGEDFFGVVLFDDEAIEVVADFAGFKVEGADFIEGALGGFVIFVGWGGGAPGVRGESGSEGGEGGLGLFEKVVEVETDLVGIGFLGFVGHEGKVTREKKEDKRG